MADYFCDHGAYATNIGATPTWGTPQEGDGSATTVAAASAVGSILFNAIPTTGGFTFCGISISTTGVLGAASVDAAANALATNINAVSTAVAVGVASGVPQLRNLMFARGPAGGAPAGTCQIMSRAGSLQMNHATNSSVAMSHTFDGTAPTVTQLIGATGGCWGWLINPTVLGVSSSIALLTYGCLIHRVLVGTALVLGDKVYVRTGAGKTVTYTEATGGARTLVPTAAHKHLIFDTNTKWTGDSGTGVFKLVFDGANIFGHNVTMPWAYNNYTTTIEALMRGSFELEAKGYGGGGGAFFKAVGTYEPAAATCRGRARLRNVKFSDTGVAASQAQFFGSSAYDWSLVQFLTCDYVAATARTTVLTKFNISSYAGSPSQYHEGCTFNYNISGAGPPGDLITLADLYNPLAYAQIGFKNCAFLGFASGYTLMSSAGAYASSDNSISVTAEGCTGLAMPGTYIGYPVSGYAGMNPDAHLFALNSLTDATNPGLRYENTRGVVEWLPSNSPLFPTLSATLLGSAAAWSLRLVWLQALNHTAATPLRCVPLKSIYRLATATRTFTVDLFVPTGLATDRIQATFHFTDSTGVLRSVTATTLAASVAAWTNAGANTGHEAKKLTIASGQSVLINTEVSCTVEVIGVAPSGTTYVWVDPEFGIA